jgi:hypothetical protein
MNFKAQPLFAAFLLGSFACADAQLAWEQQQIELHPKASDAEAVANFKYENKGKTPIKIKSTRTSCGCTVAALKKDVVEPGEKGEVTATFKIGGRTGEQVKIITVDTDDPAQPTTNLTLKAIIEQPIEIQPTFVYWETGEAPKPKAVKVKAAKDVNITKLDVISSSPEFSTEVAKGSAPGEFTVNVAPKETSHIVNAMLTIKSDLPQPYYVTARVTGPSAAGR